MGDLERTSVFLDYDGTITLGDTVVHLLDRLADPSWRQFDHDYDAGLIGSRECMGGQLAMLPRDEELLRRTAAEVPVDPDLAPLVEGLRAAGAEVTVVSDGFGFYVAEACASLDVEVLTNELDFHTWSMRFPNADRCCPCSTCGTCKQAPIRDARRRGRTTVLVGDGSSDRKAALLAQRVFAKDELAEWCDVNDVAFTPFASLADVRRGLFA